MNRLLVVDGFVKNEFEPTCNFTLHALDYNSDGTLDQHDIKHDMKYLFN